MSCELYLIIITLICHIYLSEYHNNNIILIFLLLGGSTVFLIIVSIWCALNLCLSTYLLHGCPKWC